MTYFKTIEKLSVSPFDITSLHIFGCFPRLATLYVFLLLSCYQLFCYSDRWYPTLKQSSLRRLVRQSVPNLLCRQPRHTPSTRLYFRQKGQKRDLEDCIWAWFQRSNNKENEPKLTQKRILPQLDPKSSTLSKLLSEWLVARQAKN